LLSDGLCTDPEIQSNISQWVHWIPTTNSILVDKFNWFVRIPSSFLFPTLFHFGKSFWTIGTGYRRISSNNLSGRLPDFWENLARLQTLWASEFTMITTNRKYHRSISFFLFSATPLGAGKSKDLCWKALFPPAYLNWQTFMICMPAQCWKLL